MAAHSSVYDIRQLDLLRVNLIRAEKCRVGRHHLILVDISTLKCNLYRAWLGTRSG